MNIPKFRWQTLPNDVPPATLADDRCLLRRTFVFALASALLLFALPLLIGLA